MINVFRPRGSACSQTAAPGKCMGMYLAMADNTCMIDGNTVVKSYRYETGHTGLWVGISLCIVLG